MDPLANIYAVLDSDKPRGEDLRTRVQVPRGALGTTGGVRVPIPARLQKDGRTIARHVSPGDGQGVPLHLPHEFPSGGVLRLRGQGGVREGGVPGDLFVEVVVLDRSPWGASFGTWWWLAVLAGGSTLVGVLTYVW